MVVVVVVVEVVVVKVVVVEVGVEGRGGFCIHHLHSLAPRWQQHH